MDLWHDFCKGLIGGTMIDVKKYLKEKENRELAQADYEAKIARHRLAFLFRIVIAAVAVIAAAAALMIQYERHVYTDYDTISSVERESVRGAADVRLGNSVISYSKDGIHCTDALGNVKWNQTFEMQDARLSFSGNTVAIGDYNGRSIYLADSEQLLGKIDTTMPIRDLAVSNAGYVTAVLADTDITWLYTYDASGKELYSGQARISESGYPVSVSMSPGGELLCVAFLYVDAGVLKTNVGFYNFGEVGENYPDHFVGVWIYTDVLTPYVRFMNDETAFAVGDSRLMIYTGAHIPVVKEEYLFDREVQSVFYSDRYIGLVFPADNAENRYQMVVYDPVDSGKKSFYFDIDYTDIFFGKDNFVVYNERECQIITLDGVEKFHGNFLKNVRLMLPAGNTYKYMLVTDDSIDTIQLK